MVINNSDVLIVEIKNVCIPPLNAREKSKIYIIAQNFKNEYLVKILKEIPTKLAINNP